MNPLLLQSVESCPRRALWAKDWEAQAIHPTEMLRRGIYAGLLSPREDFGEAAGEEIVALAGDRGMDVDTMKVHINLYDSAVHHAAIADLVASYLREDGPWTRPEPVLIGDVSWEANCLRDASGLLRRIVLATWWDDERQEADLRSWFTLGEIAAYQEPVQMDVIILGQHRKGRRYSAWSMGFLHPRNRKLRFKRSAHYGQRDKPFGDNWIRVWREDRSEISREDWLESMAEDDMFSELHLEKIVKVPANLQRLRELIQRKAGQLEKLKGMPDPNYSQCAGIGAACPFCSCCFGIPEQPPAEPTYIRIRS